MNFLVFAISIKYTNFHDLAALHCRHTYAHNALALRDIERRPHQSAASYSRLFCRYLQSRLGQI